MEIQSLEIFLKYLESVRRRTLRVINEIPEDAIDWKPHDDAFSFGDVIRHIGNIQHKMFGRNFKQLASAYPGHEMGGKTKDEILDHMTEEYKKLIEVVEGLTIEKILEKCVTAAGNEITIWKWMRSMIEHEVHHRGQIYAYMRIFEKESPPLYGLTSEQVKANSVELDQ